MAATRFSPKLYIPVFTITLFLSAFLLFSIQPLFGKMVLPLMGGAPMVWNTAMLFYQAVLLAGYAYAHVTSRFLGIRAQAILHIALFSIFSFVLPFLIESGIEPPLDPSHLVFWQISLMAVTIGGPFFVLSGCAPMLQHWFAKSGHEDANNPYFLYAASNAGSMLALLSYPVIFEANFTVPVQSMSWTFGYFALIGFIAVAALLIWGKQAEKKKAAKTKKKEAAQEAPTMKRRLSWLFLTFVPSSLMLGVTTYITTDLAAFPLLWIIPLALYVSTFIIVFAKHEFLPLKKIEPLYLYFFIALAFTFSGIIISNRMTLMGLHLIVFFLAALLCHKHLERLKPSTKHLTEFYFIMSLGGVCGGIFNAIIAPILFVLPVEYALVLGLSAFARYMNSDGQKIESFKSQFFSRQSIIILLIIGLFLFCTMFAFEYRYASVIALSLFGVCMMLTFAEKRRWTFAVAATATLLVMQSNTITGLSGIKNVLHLDRNFFGVTRVYDNPEAGVRMFIHGTTLHGAQALAKEHRLKSITYYDRNGPAGDLFTTLSEHSGDTQNVAALGLGIGSISCYADKGRHFDFYEIDPAVQEIAENDRLFTYLSDCGSPYDIILGDARLKMAKAESDYYDMVFMDVFSSDNIPLHLLTREAFEIYFDKLKHDGMIVVHISNRFLDLRPVVKRLAEEFGATALFKDQMGGQLEGSDINFMHAIYSVMSRDPDKLDSLKEKGWVEGELPEKEIWTDDFANPLSVMYEPEVMEHPEEEDAQNSKNKDRIQEIHDRME